MKRPKRNSSINKTTTTQLRNEEIKADYINMPNRSRQKNSHLIKSNTDHQARQVMSPNDGKNRKNRIYMGNTFGNKILESPPPIIARPGND